jgi:hypothetical protein
MNLAPESRLRSNKPNIYRRMSVPTHYSMSLSCVDKGRTLRDSFV